MAVVTSTFSTAANTAWASPTWSSEDPSFKLNTQLEGWVNAINDPTKIELIHTPGNATSRAAGQTVRWLFRAREADTGSDYGFGYERAVDALGGGQGSSGFNGNAFSYSQRSAGTSNNGSGSYSTLHANRGRIALDTAVTHFTAYEASGAVPWFAYSASDLPQSNNAGKSATIIFARLSTSSAAAGSYYPFSGLGKWAVFAQDSDGASFVTPQSRVNIAPFIGVNSPLNAYPVPYRPAWSNNWTGNGFFWAAPGLYGDTHYLGQPSSDILITTEPTGSWGDTTIISGITYRCLRSLSNGYQLSFWVKIS